MLLYGDPAQLDAFADLSRRTGIPFVEDAAQSHGAKLGGRPPGAFGRVACFSFYPGENLGAAGEGGALATDDDAIAERARRLRDHAQAGRHNHVEIGLNYRMEGVQDTVLGVKLGHIDRWNTARRVAAARYAEILPAGPGVSLPSVTPGAESAWQRYVVRLRERDRVAARLAEMGVGTGLHYPTPVHLQPAYADLGGRRGDLPNVEAFAAEYLSLPMFAAITPDQQARVADALSRAVTG